jgi:hypothetical protein
VGALNSSQKLKTNATFLGGKISTDHYQLSRDALNTVKLYKNFIKNRQFLVYYGMKENTLFYDNFPEELQTMGNKHNNSEKK